MPLAVRGERGRSGHQVVDRAGRGRGCRGRGGGVVRACLGAGGCAADPADKAEVYGQLGLTLTYDPAARKVKAEARPESIMYVGTCPRAECTNKPMRPDD